MTVGFHEEISFLCFMDYSHSLPLTQFDILNIEHVYPKECVLFHIVLYGLINLLNVLDRFTIDLKIYYRFKPMMG